MQHRSSKNILHSILYVSITCMLAFSVQVMGQAADQEPEKNPEQEPALEQKQEADQTTNLKAIAWADLNKYERLALQSLESNWAELEPEQQQQFQIAAERMLTRTIARESFNRDRVRRWSKFSRDRREHMRKRYRHYRDIDPDERKKMHEARKRFENLSEEEKQEIQKRWESLPADQRQRFGPPGHRRPPPGMRGQRSREFEKLSEEEKQEWREMRKERRGALREQRGKHRRDHRVSQEFEGSPEQTESGSLKD